MNTIRKYFKKSPILLGVLLLNGALIVLLAIPAVQPAQAAPKRTRTPRPTPSSIHTPTPTLVAATPTPTGPICWSVVPAPAVPGYGEGLRTENQAVRGDDEDVRVTGDQRRPELGSPQ